MQAKIALLSSIALRVKVVCLSLAAACGVIVSAPQVTEAQQSMDSSGRYFCQSRQIYDGRTRKFMTISALNKAVNSQISALNKKIKKTKNKATAKALRAQIAALRNVGTNAKKCLAGSLPTATPTPTATPSGPTPTPTLTPTPGIPRPHIAVGYDHSVTNSQSGVVRSFGDNNFKQLGIGSGPSQSTPVSPTGLASINMKAAAGGGRHACAAPVAGQVYCWGNNSNAQATGDPSTVLNQADPVAVMGVTGEYVQVVAGDSHSCAVQKSGGVICWGGNNSGECGNGSTSTKAAATTVAGLTISVTKIATFRRHTCAVLGNGSVQCWGLNSYGQLGTGDYNQRSTATTPNSLRAGVSVVDVAAGNDHNCALYQDGVVQCIGQNDTGQIGQGVNTHSYTVYTTVPLGAASAISAGNDFTCAIYNSQSGVACWGEGSAGQLGNGAFADSSSPVAVVGLSGTIVGITAGDTFACALNSAGAVYCWGSNASRQLGNNGGSSSTAVVVSGLNLNS